MHQKSKSAKCFVETGNRAEALTTDEDTKTTNSIPRQILYQKAFLEEYQKNRSISKMCFARGKKQTLLVFGARFMVENSVKRSYTV